MKHIYMAILAAFFVYNAKAQSVATFDELTLSPESFWNGSDQSGSFKSGAMGGEIKFINSYNTDWQSWSGFAYSNMNDISTPGYINQYSAITGKGIEEGKNYGVCYPSPMAELGFTLPGKIIGFYITNSTYAYLSMKNGDAYSKKFGGETGNDPDYFNLMIEGLNGNGLPVDTINFSLADFRFADNSKDYILNDWTWVDLNNLKVANKLRFSLSSSDNAVWGMNTPGYFCIDNLKYEIMVSAPEIQQIQASIFPNPFNDRIIISGLKENANVTVSDISGRILREFINISNNQLINGLGNLKPGVYFLTVNEGRRHFTSKLVKK